MAGKKGGLPMNPQGLAEVDRLEFERLCSELGSAALDVLKESLAEEVWNHAGHALPDDVRSFVSLVDTGWLERAGRQELASWMQLLPRQRRRRVKSSLSALLGGVGKSPQLAMHKSLVVSFQNALHSPFDDRVDILHRAGLHHAARCLADCGADSLLPLLRGMDPSWIQCLMLFHGDLVESRFSRRPCAAMRRHWLQGVA